jgi:hypothetical protein
LKSSGEALISGAFENGVWRARPFDEFEGSFVHPLAHFGRFAGAVLNPVKIRRAYEIDVRHDWLDNVQERFTDVAFVPDTRDERIGVCNHHAIGREPCKVIDERLL